ncbi:capsule assembly Wzi family protein [Chitinophaga sp. XS-30]|uniref:capsule assembly Wzi family protein n=1 Tax=Chitinophaga sp. XS-30 TaxID=2604421 RepID=UPI0011DDB98A|nr:capsule assembly Wzi family protein [Chitinophaga sp. XS-30]QEH40433.1 capsule assembly Wzi family protein [Chitinophaga sp. XS-30]
MKCLLQTISFILLFSCAQAQFADSLDIRVGTQGMVATADYQPLWLVSNRFGTISDRKSDLSSYIRIRNRHVLGQGENFQLRYGLSLYNNNRFGDVLLQEGYIKAAFKKLELRAGRYEEIIGEMDKDLSSGSLGLSGNAMPVPKISIALTDYVDIPFTNGWVQFKGQFGHGWMGKRQYIRNAFLHEKTIYLRIGKNRLKLFGGLQHYAVWGGNRKDLPNIKADFSDYLNVVFAKEADDGTVISDEILPNRPGDHRGVLEGGIDWENDNMHLRLFNQTPFETGQGIDLRNIDRLLGIVYTNKKENAILQKLTGEFIYTKQMNDFFHIQYRESYYNNGIYLTGWEYQDRIAGTPLFINRQRGSKYFESIRPFDWDAPKDSISGKGWNILNNRVTGLHLGAMYNIGLSLAGKTFLTWTKNHGTYHNGLFDPARTQWYTLQQVSYRTPVNGLSLTGSVGLDWGEISDNTGFMLGVQWQFSGARP